MRSWCNGYRLREMDPVTRVQSLNEAVLILHSIDTLSKGVNLTIFPSAMCNIPMIRICEMYIECS